MKSDKSKMVGGRWPGRSGWASLGAATGVLLLAKGALAQLCVTTPVPLPGLSGPPVWFATAGAFVRTELDDPRWAGAPLRTFPQDPTGTQAAYRVLQDDSELTISLQALLDTAPSPGDFVSVGVTTDGTGNKAWIFKIFPEQAGSPDPVAANLGLSLQCSFKDGALSDWADCTSGPPAWFQSAGTWRNSPVGANWAVNLKLKLGDLSLAGNYRLYLGMTVDNAGGSGVAVPYGIPSVAPDEPVAGFPGVPLPASWQEVTKLGDPCTVGVSISSYDVGVVGDHPNKIVKNQSNTFEARIHNVPEPHYANKVQAKFSIANWGSTIADPDAGWDTVKDFAEYPEVPDSTGGYQHPMPGSADPQTARITSVCDAGVGVSCPALPPGADDHQCMLVELRPKPPNDFAFQNSAVYRNMDFVDAADLDKSAKLSTKVKGRPLAGDLYLRFQKKNLPPHGKVPVALKGEAMGLARRYAAEPPFLRRAPIKEERALAKRMAKLSPPRWSKFEDRLALPVLSPHQALAEVWPMAMVHVFRDTGRKMKVRDKLVKVLEPMVPYGYFVKSDAPSYGFTAQLEASGGPTLERVADDLFKVTPAATGELKLRTRIVAEKKPVAPVELTEPACRDKFPCPPCTRNHCDCTLPGRSVGSDTGLWLLSAGAFIATFLARRRRR